MNRHFNKGRDYMINTNYSMDLLSLLSGSNISQTATSSSTNFNDILSSYLQQSSSSALNVDELIAGLDTTSSTGVANLLGTNSTYSYYLNSLLSGSTGTGTEAMQTYLAQSDNMNDQTDIMSMFGGQTTNASSSNTLANILMATYEAKQMQTVQSAQTKYKEQIASLQQGEQTSAVQDRIAKLNTNAAALESYVQNTLTNSTKLATSSNFNGVFNSIAALQQDILAKYEQAKQQTTDTNKTSEV